MSKFTEILGKIKNTSDFEESGQVLLYLGNVIKDTKKLSVEELNEIMSFAVEEMKRLLTVIPNEKSYKKKDEIFFYEDKLLMVYTLAGGKNKDTFGKEEDIDIIRQLVELVGKETAIEDAVDNIFKLNLISKADIEKVLDIVKPIEDEYRRGKFFQGLIEYKKEIKKLSADAKITLADYIVKETERLLNIAQSDNDATNSLEYVADVCKYFINDRLLELLEQMMKLKSNNIRYYALETLLDNKCDVSENAIRELAEDIEYADLTHGLLSKYGKAKLFPTEFASAEYLAKSNMVHWLMYPTELGKKPDEIQLLGDTVIRKDTYYIFKYKSDSDNLSDDLRNEWLIGWANSNGNTFSNFDLLSDFEGKDLKKTLKKITKKLKRIE
ncbi:MAG: hypothetical protein K2I23_04120 [Clostridia bacterium]|nr:hypothetical protein [Clostridia bacterium]